MDAKKNGAALLAAAQGNVGELDALLETLDERELATAILHVANVQNASKRELFAAMAMQGLAANPGGPVQANPMCGWSLTNCTFEQAAEFAVALADALLSQLSEAQVARVEGGAE